MDQTPMTPAPATPNPVAAAPAPASAATLPSASDLLKQAWAYYKQHWKRLIKVALISWVIIAVATILVGVSGYTTTSTTHPFAPAFSFALLIYLVVIIVAGCWQYVSLIYAVSPEGETKGWQEIYKLSKRWIWPYFLVALISGVLTVIGLILLIIPGLIIAVWFCLASFIVVNENQGAIAALKTSRNYVRGKFNAVLWRWFIFLLVTIGASIIVSIVGNLFGNTGKSIVNMVFTLFLTPFVAVYGVRLYRAVRSAQ